MIFYSPAKLNLFLSLVDIRSDGYCNIESLIIPIDLFDIIKVEYSKNFSLTIDGEFADSVDKNKNFFTDIFSFFVSEYKICNGLNVEMQKNIPVGAGLGGGSSNAAKFIKILNQFFKLNLSKSQMSAIGLKFGSDVPFFLEECPAFVFGRGEIIKPISKNTIQSEQNSQLNKVRDIKFLIVNPKILLRTDSVFSKAKQKITDSFSGQLIKKSDKMSFLEMIINFPNDLTKSAICIVPEIEEILQKMNNLGADVAKMTGSGSTCFAVFQDNQKLIEAEKFFKKNYPDFFVSICQILEQKF